MSDDIRFFIHDIIDDDLKSGRVKKIHTRFPPEPNGYLHIGSAKAIYINYSIAKKYGGLFNLRYDDTNPDKEDDEYVKSIYEDLLWLGAVPDKVLYGSDYFEQCYQYAIQLIKQGDAYVCDLSADEMRQYRGTLTEPGKPSPYRERSVEQNLELFEKMRSGVLPDGACTLRAKIDMSSSNMNLRDPAIYRICHQTHHRQGDKWCIYPLYDYAHPIQDALEGITHSLCSLEFENHRPLYDWVIEKIGFENPPHQYEFARLNMTHTVMSKRYFRKLVENKVVDGWDDPRMPTLSGLRRRGYTPESIFEFIKKAGVSKSFSIVDIGVLEFCIRDELNFTAPRRIAVLDPVKLIIDNYPDDKLEYFEMSNNPNDPESGSRKLPFTKELFIERADFKTEKAPKFFRLYPGNEVRLMNSYIVKCTGFDTDENGNVTAVHCTADIETGCNMPADGRKVKGTIHWVSADQCVDAAVNMYDRLFSEENLLSLPEDTDYDDCLNPDSIKVLTDCKLEKSLADAKPADRFQFVRNGYFCRDIKHTDKYVFNSIVALRDSKGK